MHAKTFGSRVKSRMDERTPHPAAATAALLPAVDQQCEDAEQRLTASDTPTGGRFVVVVR
jgi:hypothetical protein